jgi:hypothetical protein
MNARWAVKLPRKPSLGFMERYFRGGIGTGSATNEVYSTRTIFFANTITV